MTAGTACSATLERVDLQSAAAARRPSPVITLRDFFSPQGPGTAACLGCHDNVRCRRARVPEHRDVPALLRRGVRVVSRRREGLGRRQGPRPVEGVSARGGRSAAAPAGSPMKRKGIAMSMKPWVLGGIGALVLAGLSAGPALAQQPAPRHQAEKADAAGLRRLPRPGQGVRRQSAHAHPGVAPGASRARTTRPATPATARASSTWNRAARTSRTSAPSTGARERSSASPATRATRNTRPSRRAFTPPRRP